MTSPRLLVVEDEASLLASYVAFGNQAGYETSGAKNFINAQSSLLKSSFDIVLVDIHLSADYEKSEGLELIAMIQSEAPATLVIATSSDPSLPIYQKALELGAFGFLRKPLLSAEDLKIGIANALRNRNQQSGLKGLRDTSRNPEAEDGLVLSTSLREVARKVARSRSLPVVIYGETGTGKEEFAKLIHKRRCEAEGEVPFVAVNCAHLNGSMSMSMLFGHRKGAFTGATSNTVGYIGEADGGILFLDEIHTLERDCQQRLLRTLNDGSYQPLGSTKTQHSRFQLIAASTKDLDEATERNEFLIDLRMRIIGLDVFLPPLRERLSDIPQFVRLFFAKEKTSLPASERQAIIEACQKYYWQGNVRQLFQVLHSLIVMSSYNAEDIKVQNLPIFKTMLPPGSSLSLVSTSMPPVGVKNDILNLVLKPLTQDVGLDEALEAYEKLVIDAALARHATVNGAVQALGVSRSSLAAKRQKYNSQPV